MKGGREEYGEYLRGRGVLGRREEVGGRVLQGGSDENGQEGRGRERKGEVNSEDHTVGEKRTREK